MNNILFATITILLLTKSYAEELMPPDVQRLIDQRASAIAKIDRVYLQELEKLKVMYTKRGNLEIANKISDLHKNAIKDSLYSDSDYLDDLTELDVKCLLEVGKHGKKSTGDKSGFTFNKKIPEHSLFTHPEKDGIASISYKLNGSYDKFTGIVGITDTVRPHSAMTFRVLDGQAILWESEPITRSHSSQEFKINVKGRGRIILEVKSHGSTGEAHAVWITPQLHK